jgi:hypothetical protein
LLILICDTGSTTGKRGKPASSGRWRRRGARVGWRGLGRLSPCFSSGLRRFYRLDKRGERGNAMERGEI